MRILLVCLAGMITLAAAEESRKPGGRNRAPRTDATATILRNLDPDGAQCRVLAPLAREARSAAEERAAEEARVLPEFREALLRLRAEVQADRGLAPETMKAASGLNDRLKDGRAETAHRIEALAERARGILGEEACRRAGLDESSATHGEASKDPSIARLRREIARIHEEQYGSVGKLGRWLATPGLAETLEARAEGRGSAPAPAPRAKKGDALEREIAALRHEINLWNLINGLHLTREQLAAIAAQARGRTRSVARVLEALSPEQEAVLYDYKACLVPPRNLRDPVRAGQANDTGAGERLLARLRAIPEQKFARQEEGILLDTLRGIEEKEGSYTDGERFACFLLLSDVVRRARAMDDAAFAVRAPDLAREIEPLRKLDSLRREMKGALGAERVVALNTERFLLDPKIPALCRQRIDYLASAPPIEPAGAIEKAERCDGGNACGRP